MQESFYASEELVSKLSMPKNIAEMARYPLVTSVDRESGINRWLTQTLLRSLQGRRCSQ